VAAHRSTCEKSRAMNVSVAMATDMGAAYVVEQLTSIVEQTAPPAEIASVPTSVTKPKSD
jgi:hypothetical protein